MTLFLTVLKIIGIVLLVILGLLLLSIATVLFVPIRYVITADLQAEDDHYDIKIKVSWLLHIVRGFASFLRTGDDEDSGDNSKHKEPDSFRYEFKVLWKKLFPKDEEDEREYYPEESYDLSTSGAFKDEDYGTGDTSGNLTEQAPETEEAPGGAAGQSAESSDNSQNPSDEIPETGSASSEQASETAEYANYSYDSSRDSSSPDREEDLWKDDIPKGFRAKLKDFVKLLRRIRKRAGKFKHNAGYKFNSFCDKIQELKSNAGHLRDMIDDESNREAVKLLFNEILRILRAIRIRKYKVDLIYGFDDPALTGEITGLLSVLFLSCGRKVNIVPDFDRFRIDGDMYFKGRLMVITLIIVLWRLYFNKDFRKLFREIRR